MVPCPSQEDVYWILRATVKEGMLNDLKALQREMSSVVMTSEPGCLAYEWHLAADEKSCHIYECYSGSDAILVHVTGTFATFQERFFQCLTPIGMEIYGSPSDEVRAAAAPFNAVYFNRFGGFNRSWTI
jgi:quinol monooxygenase YgiN